MEAALRTAAELITGKRFENLEFTDVRAVEGLREASLELGGITLNVAVSNGITNAKKILKKVMAGKKQYHLIEIMACPGGCIGGGGQPYPPKGMKVLDPEIIRLRAKALYQIDKNKQLRRSHENPAIITLYNEFLGEKGGEKAHELLHTHYAAKLPRGIR
jgi:NADP-reducing hydrogenase subunit HndD